MKLTKFQAEELCYRLDIVASEPDLLDDYGLSQAQVEALCATVPDRGDWDCPAWAIDMVREELGVSADILRDTTKMLKGSFCLDDEGEKRRRRDIRKYDRQARELEKC